MRHLRSLSTVPLAIAAAVVAATTSCGRDEPAPGGTPPAVAPPAAADPAPAPAPPRTPVAAEGATPSPIPTDAPKGEVPPEAREPRDPPKAEVGPTTPAVEPPTAPPPPPPRAPLSADALAVLVAARAKTAAGDAGGAIADLRAAETKLGPIADLLIEQGRAFLALAEESLARGDDSFLVKGLVADAHVRWKKATALDAAVPGAATLRARVLRFEENPAAAKETLESHLAAHPDDAEAHAVLADMATTSRDWQTADDHWTRVAVLDPGNGKARLQATIAKQWMRVPAAQLESGYLDAARLLPDDGEPIRLLAQLAKDRDGRLALLRKVVAENPKAVTARLWIAHILRTEGTPDLKGAGETLAEAAKLAPKNADVHYNLGLLHEQTGAPVEAVREYAECVENSEAGNSGRASDAIDRLLHDPATGAGKDVPLTLRVRAMDAVCAKNPTEGRYGNNAGLWFRDVGRDYELSLKYYLKSCEAAPDDQDYLNDTGLIYLFHLTDRKQECMRYFDRVIELVEVEGQEPVRGYWDTLENLCKVWFEKGEFAKVVEIAKKRADPKASVDGTPYPSFRAAQYGAAAAKKLADAR